MAFSTKESLTTGSTPIISIKSNLVLLDPNPTPEEIPIPSMEDSEFFSETAHYPRDARTEKVSEWISQQVFLPKLIQTFIQLQISLAKAFIAFGYNSMWEDWVEGNVMHHSHLGLCGGEKRRTPYQI